MLSVFRSVGIPQQVKFANRVDSQQLSAGAARLHVVFGGARKLNAVQQKEILLRPVPVDGKHICRRRVGDPDPAGFFPCEVDYAWIQYHKQVVASSIRGRSLTCCSPTSPEISAGVTLTTGASSNILTWSVTWPSFNAMSTLASCPTTR